MMSRAPIPRAELIEVLIDRRFGTAQSDQLSAHRARQQGRQPDYEAIKARAEGRDRLRSEISALSDAELSAMDLRDRQEAAQHARRMSEAREAAFRFNKPLTQSDIDHWAIAAQWSIEEAIALSLNRLPDRVNEKAMAAVRSVSRTAAEFIRRRDLTERACKVRDLQRHMRPQAFVAWFERSKMPLPDQLVSAIKAHDAPEPDWEALFREAEETHSRDLLERSIEIGRLEAENRRLESELSEALRQLASRPEVGEEHVEAEAPLSSKERQSLRRLVIAMATGRYKYDPTAGRSDAVTLIRDQLDRLGIGLSPNTIRKYLVDAAEELPQGVLKRVDL